MPRPILPAFGLLALLAGCGTKWSGIDVDGDGYSAADGDCWEGTDGPIPGISGSDIYPGAPDSWYDGVDADCSGNDDYDADGDGFVPEKFLGLDTLGIVESTGALHKGIDCWDAPDDVVLGDGTVDNDYVEAWRADGDNADWVADNGGDSAMPFVVVAGPYASGGASFVQPLPSQVNPDAAEDLLYDDVDQNCDGEGEFDQDGDGQDAMVQPRRSGEIGYDCVDGSDLEDFDADNLAGLAPADIFGAADPGDAADDVWYDGVDQDCDMADDCDQDGDSYLRVPAPGTVNDPFGGAYDYPTMLDVCGVDDSYNQDCKDVDASVAPDPSIAEIFYNYTDDNCIIAPGDLDGDKDGDGHWDAGYDPELADSTVADSVEGQPIDDCFDDPDNRPVEMFTAPVFKFDAAMADLTDPTALVAAYDADGDGNTDEVAAADVYPGAFDRPYDGVDQDCAGDVSTDHDWDGDGYSGLYQYENPGTGWSARGDDCMDCSDDCGGAELSEELAAVCADVCDNDAYTGADPQLTNAGGLPSTSVNPGRTAETWYDGTDEDCSRTSDFDADGDSYGDRAYEGDPGIPDDDPWEIIDEGRPGYYAGGLRGGGDCNDADDQFGPHVTGEANEDWYDGLDHNCDDKDDYDADEDGDRDRSYAAAATYQDSARTIVAVASGATTNTDCVDNPTATNATLYHGGSASEVWYDGFDYDCQDNDDYDADADGQRADEYAAAATYHASVVVISSGANANTDCVDDLLEATDAASYGLGFTDTWYDGKDYDCAGNDDYDRDADGDRNDGYTAAQTIQGAETVVTSSANPNTDCVDTDTDYYGGAPDAWYDGEDFDCQEDDDYDADVDGHRSDDYGLSATVQGSTVVVAASAALADDCVDDPTVSDSTSYYTGAADAWYDGKDYDCGGDDDYDADADSYRSDAYTAAATVQASTTVVGALDNPNTDCIDDPASVTNASSYNPGATEVWYDGEDWDCALDDDFDADADGFRSEDETAAATYQGADIVVALSAAPSTDCVDDPTEDSAADSYYPGATDAWYDGKDFDCAGNDDFDKDADGYRSDAYTAAATVQGASTVVSSSANPNTDCVDTSTAYNPGQSDTWYDGLDHDCAENDDYDQDVDGYRSDAYASAPTTQDGSVVVSSGASPNTDCVDTSVAYNPGATDTWYDGLDHDCQEDDDYDKDVDGFRTDALTATATTQDGVVVVALGAADSTDCVDDDADYNPDAIEEWYDGADWDCAEDDDYDADGDGQRSDQYAAAATVQDTVTIIASTAAANTDCVDDPDDDVDAADYYLGASDAWYDGLDTDCADNDDYDQDGDGQRSSDYAAAATVQGPVTTVASSAAANTDCVDTSTAYYDGAPDTWYDGLDHDCAGNDDYDQDGDGQRSDAYAAAATLQGATTVVALGANANTDCVDSSSAYALGASDAWYDGLDHDCLENDDYDQDGDGQRSDDYAASATRQALTIVVATSAAANTDCVDTSTLYSQGASDTWYDGLDHDCNGDDDYDRDADGDRSSAYAAAATFQGATTVVAAGAAPNLDCVDTDAAYNTVGASDTWYDGLDHDCAGNDDFDQDADGHRSDAYAAAATTQSGSTVVASGANPNDDCVDTDTAYYTGASDAWYDGEDHDCAGNDDYDQDVDGQRTTAVTATATVQGATVVVALAAASSTDCVDTDTDYYLGASDTWYDGFDHDCVGDDDYDQDGDNDRNDGYAALATLQGSTTVVAAGANPNSDCVDTNTAYASTATEIWYDGLDHDCAGDDDYDQDGDGERSDAYGPLATTQDGSTVVAAGANPNTDCVDTSASYYTGATEVWYDGFDYDCAGDDDYDVDADGYRSEDYAAAATVQDAVTVVGLADNPNTDCVDDTVEDVDAASYNPVATDTWYDGADWDCAEDDDFDADGDGERSDAYAATATVQGATTVVASGFAPNVDCDDDDATILTTATEIWYDGTDQDCDGLSDYDADLDGLDRDPEGLDCDDADAGVLGPLTWYADSDTDTYGDPLTTTDDCTMPVGYVADNTDCNDADGAISPAGSETLNGVDDDCNGYRDDDGVITAGDEYILITEFIANPTGLDTAYEWVELYNPNAFDIVMEPDLWTIGRTTSSSYTFTGPISIASGDHVVVGRNTAQAASVGVTLVEAYGSGLLIPQAGTQDIYIEYDDPTAVTTVEVDVVDFEMDGTWSTIYAEGYSVELDRVGMGYPNDNNDVSNWCQATTQWSTGDYGTPGDPNGC